MEISVDHLSFWYDKNKRLFDRVSFQLEAHKKRGRVVAVMGVSGVGKTTLLRLLARIIKPREGQIKLQPHEGVISYLPQEPVLFEHLSIHDNIYFFNRIAAYHERFNEETVKQMINFMDMDKVMDKSINVKKLSGGEQQRISLIRAMSIQPQLLLLDEPCTGLGGAMKYDLMVKLREIIDQKKLLVFYVTHHPNEAQLLADDVLYIPSNGDFADNSSGVMLKPLLEFLTAPPTLQALMMVVGSAINVFKCRKDGQTIILNSTGTPICRCSLSGSDGPCLLAFTPERVCRSTKPVLNIKLVGASSHHWFLRPNPNSATIAMQQDGQHSPPQYISLEGPAFLFRSPQNNVSRVVLKRF